MAENTERIIGKHAKFGKTCVKCKIYFVTEDETATLCRWCERIESGQPVEEAFVMDDFIEL